MKRNELLSIYGELIKTKQTILLLYTAIFAYFITAAELHIALVNLSATAKNAGDTGDILIDFVVRPVAFS